jgi:glycosyltransferase involved in cell wall biosynthesis
MRVLYLTFYFEPDIGPGSFRNTALVAELARQLTLADQLHVITTQPNRYKDYTPTAREQEACSDDGCSVSIDRVSVPRHKSGRFDQIRSFWAYFREVHRLTKHRQYDLIIASSSRIFTAFLAARLARKTETPLILDIRDLFREAILDVHPNLLIRLTLNPLLKFVERYTFGYARHINLVSEGFRSYFDAFPRATYSYFPNAIDEKFLAIPASVPNTNPVVRTIVYAGNIGDGQGLHTIIPQAAKLLADRFRFIVIGAGSARRKLENAIRAQNITNIELYPPVSQDELLVIYQQADYLFVHLNTLEACKRVLPSKLFEYGATDKPIIAGVSGYAASFVRTNLTNSIVFEPGDVLDLVNQLRQAPYQIGFRYDFRERFQRKTITQAMVQHILQSVSGLAKPDERIPLTDAKSTTDNRKGAEFKSSAFS